MVRLRGAVDVVAELFELSDECFAATAGLVLAGEVVGAQLGVCGLVDEEVPAGDKDRVGDCDEGALVTSAFGDPSEPHGEVAVFGSHR